MYLLREELSRVGLSFFLLMIGVTEVKPDINRVGVHPEN
jgi:hypothetical protein